MSDAMVQSWRPLRRESALPWRLLAAAGGLLAIVVAGGAVWWGWQKLSIRTIPVVEADTRPFKVRPGDPGGLRVPNQTELVLERPGNRTAQASRAGAIAPETEAPNVNGLRAAVTPPPPRPAAQPQAAPIPAPTARIAQPATPPVATPVAAPAPRPATGRVQVQLGALASEEAARAEWDRMLRRAPELMQGRVPQIFRLEREGQTPLFRLRTGAFGDQDQAREFCEQLRGRGAACVALRP